MLQKAHTALLFFSRTAADEATVKTFHQRIGKKGNTTISQYLIRQSLSTLQKTNLPYFTSYSSQQVGNTFGERLANAIESIYAKGYKRVVVIGNDCPFVSPNMIWEVSQKLENKKLVLGPSPDGGVYLIGIEKNAYNRQKFIALPWQKAALQSELQKYAIQVFANINWLQIHFDIDNVSDFKKLLNALSFQNVLRKRLMSILAVLHTFPVFEADYFHTIILSSNLSLRAP